ncbi:MAG: flagellar hook-associated protein FlgK, partial [Halanaerobiaceae bacterium]
MGNLFNSLNIGLSSLKTQKTGMDTTGHNISNANNDKYSRQRVNQSAKRPHAAPSKSGPHGAGQIGSGVEAKDIERLQDDFINSQIQEESQTSGYWAQMSEGLERIEETVAEPSDTSLSNALDQFWDSLQDLSNNPEDSAARSTVRERADVVVENFHNLNDQLTDYQKSLNEDLGSEVSNINSLGRRIADLNKEIVSVKGSGQSPNDLMDKRDDLFDKLNEKVNVQKQVDERGNMQISIGGRNFVHGEDVKKLDLESESEGDRLKNNIIFADSGKEADIRNGELAGLLDVRDVEIEDSLAELDQMAGSFAKRFNEVHKQGYDLQGKQGEDFFSLGSDDQSPAEQIEVSDNIKDDINRIAAGRFSGEYSDNSDVATVNIDDPSKLSDGDYIEVENVDNDTVGYTVYDKDGNVQQDSDGNDLEDIEVDVGDTEDLTKELGIELEIHDVNETDSDKTTIEFAANPGNGENALALSETINKDELEGLEGSSFEDYYSSFVSSLGVDAQRADKMVDNQDSLRKQLEKRKESVSGVNLDEEMSNLIKYQQAYHAASKVISRTDEMLSVLMQT